MNLLIGIVVLVILVELLIDMGCIVFNVSGFMIVGFILSKWFGELD